MMKKLHLFCIAFSLGIISLNAQSRDAAPSIQEGSNTDNQIQSNALFDVLFNYDIGATGTAGIIFFNNEFWISEWQTDQIHVADNTGAYIESFAIGGVTGTRSFTTDGTNIYIGTAGLDIFQIDPSTRALTGVINITTTSDAAARMLTYDSTLDGGNGGFWISSFGSDIASIDMNGNELSVIPAATHGQSAIYGGAVDNVSPGGPYLWVHDQTPSGDSEQIVQLQLPSGTPTGVVYSYLADAPATITSALAGGLFISDDVASNAVTLVGLCQCAPSNMVFGLELVNLEVKENHLTDFILYPNPSNGGMVTIETSVPGKKEVTIFNMLGKQVIKTSIEDNNLNISSLNSGIYMVQIAQNNQLATKKLVVR